MQNHPIPSVTEALQYRAIGIVKGIYKPLDIDNNFTRGVLIDSKGVEIDSVVLGRVITLMKRYVKLDKPHYWIVYPRCRDSESLHLQINGIWEPSTLSKDIGGIGERETPEGLASQEDSIEEGDNYFSVRGELIFTNPGEEELVIKVRQKQKNTLKKHYPFKIILKGNISVEYLRHFVSLKVRRHCQTLYMEKYEVIASIPRREKRKGAKGDSFNKIKSK